MDIKEGRDGGGGGELGNGQLLCSRGSTCFQGGRMQLKRGECKVGFFPVCCRTNGTAAGHSAVSNMCRHFEK
jgi:hypothetical protein